MKVRTARMALILLALPISGCFTAPVYTPPRARVIEYIPAPVVTSPQVTVPVPEVTTYVGRAPQARIYVRPRSEIFIDPRPFCTCADRVTNFAYCQGIQPYCARPYVAPIYQVPRYQYVPPRAWIERHKPREHHHHHREHRHRHDHKVAPQVSPPKPQAAPSSRPTQQHRSTAEQYKK